VIRVEINVGFRNYVIEKRNASYKQWGRASGCVSSDATQFKVCRLDEGQTYLFRVCAENDQGCGPALTTQFETLTKDPFGKLNFTSVIYISRLSPSFEISHTYRHYYTGRVHSGKRNVTVWRPSICLSVPSAYSP